MEYPSDEGVMEAIQRGDPDLLGVLFTRYSERVFGRCFQLVGDRSEADDLVQESFLRVLRYRHSFKGTASFSTWLYRLVTNVCLDHLKAKGRETATHRELALDRVEGWTGAESSERIELVRRALARLPADKRELLVKIRIQGYRYAELARADGASEGAIRVRVHRAMRELRRVVETLAEGSP